MRSTPSLDRGRFTLPRDLSAAVITAAALAFAILVLGWLTSGLITGTWSPRDQVASVTHADLKLAPPSDREAAVRPARARVHASHARPAAAKRQRADAAPAPRSPRRVSRDRRVAPASAPASTPAPPVSTPPPVAPAVPPVTTATETVAAAQPAPAPTRQPTEVSTPASPWRDEADRGDRHRGPSWRGHDREKPVAARPVPAPAPAPAPAPTADDHSDNHGWDRGDDRWDNDRDDRHRGRWGR